MFRNSDRLALAGCVMMTAVSPGAADGNIGTLVCTVSPGDAAPIGVERRLSCNFDPVTGPNARFTGTVKRIGAEVPGQRKIVLAWSVVGPAQADTEKLEGRYVGSLEQSRSAAAGLIGGRDGTIRLQPLALAPEVGANAAISILELELSGMRA